MNSKIFNRLYNNLHNNLNSKLLPAILIWIMIFSGIFAGISKTSLIANAQENPQARAIGADTSGLEKVVELVKDSSGAYEIRSVKELLRARDYESGSFILMTDLDMTGVSWEPWDFKGVFNGNNHSILNLKVETTGKATRKTYDGNRKEYDTKAAGFFGVLENSEVKDLNLIGADVAITSDTHCFAGIIAGITDTANISNCLVDGRVSLTSPAVMWGVGGFVGFGSGSIDSSVANVTLVCVDTDKQVKDEQFLGGAFGAGFIDLTNDTIILDGYISDHGYVHSGGLVGMYMVYPVSLVSSFKGKILNDSVDGKITFFEDNRDRRAYCAAHYGEVMNWTFEYAGFKSSFERNEIYDYSKDLLPEACPKPAYSSVITAPTESALGFTTHTCSSCGYSFKDSYTVHEHKVENYTKEGNYISGVCSLCNETVYEEYVEEQPSEATDNEAATQEEKKNNSKGNNVIVYIIILVIIAICAIAFILVNISNNKKKRRRRKKKAVRK